MSHPAPAVAGHSTHAPSAGDLLVVGSCNADTFVEVNRLPQVGETIPSSRPNTGFVLVGGKGANQAVQSARLLGAAMDPDAEEPVVAFIGCFGDDQHAPMIRNFLSLESIDLTAVNQLDGMASGQAFIFLCPNGDNAIVIVGGANAAWPAEGLSKEQSARCQRARVVLLQREIPDEINSQAARIANESGAKVILDCGGKLDACASELLRECWVVSPNETELAALTQLPTETDDNVIVAARALQAQGAGHVLVKLGVRGSLLVPASESEPVVRVAAVPAPKVIDTTGAGDCFSASFGVGVLEGMAMADAMRFGSCAASLCVRIKGCTSSFPNRPQVDELLAETRAQMS